jgi:DNA-binding NarL/FixJ family response regulator
MVLQPAIPGGRASPLNAAIEPLCSLGLYNGRTTCPVVGRSRELSAISQGMISARAGLASTVIEGEPGIGKTRFLLAIDEMATAEGFISTAVTADEEIRGPFLLARSIFACPVLTRNVQGTPAAEQVGRAVDALSNRGDNGLSSLTPDQRLVRVFDLAASALRAVAAVRPLALLVDDLQWADEDSLRLLRYVVRTSSASPIFLVLAIRPHETAQVSEAITLLADVDRLGVLQRLQLARFSQLDSAAFLEHTLGGRVDPRSASVMHAQSEGLPFVLSEQVRAYREAGLVQSIDGVWTLARNADRLLPSAVRTLIQRRSARLPDDTKTALAEAAVLGRNFSLRDLGDVRAQLGGDADSSPVLAALLAPAVDIGLLTQLPDGSAADYSFTHEGVREYAAETLAPPRRRAVHGAVVDLLMAGGVPPPGSLAMLAGHALAAGRGDLCAQVAVEAARLALQSNAPEEVLRLIALAQPVAAGAQARVELLRLRDEALEMLRRPAQRLEGLTELSALAEALGDDNLELEVMLRRAGALRLSGDHDVAAGLARRVRERARDLEIPAIELAACLELGQDLLHAELGDANTQTPSEGDFDGAEEAYRSALALAEQLDDQAKVAAVSRELGVILTSRVRVWFVERVAAGELLDVMKELVAGKTLDDLLPSLPIAPLVMEGAACFHRALEIYEGLGDRRGVMSAVVAMAVLTWAPGIHLGGSVQHIEEIRRLSSRVKSFTRESERALADVQMLFGAAVYARNRGFADLALSKGQEAYNAARAMGDRSLEFATAGLVALQHAELGSVDDSRRWLDRAAAIATESQTPLRALQLETWRGLACAETGDVDGFRRHFQHALSVATEQAKPAPRCQTLSVFAARAARLGVSLDDAELTGEAEQAAHEVEALAARLPGHPPWRARALAAIARIELSRGDHVAAAEAGRSALELLRMAFHEELHLDVLLPSAAALIAAGTEAEAAAELDQVRMIGGLVAQRIVDESVRVRWFSSDTGRELVALSGPIGPVPGVAQRAIELDHADRALLRLVTEARSNAEIATSLGIDEAAVRSGLASLFGKMGVGTRADATAAALIGSLV